MSEKRKSQLEPWKTKAESFINQLRREAPTFKIEMNTNAIVLTKANTKVVELDKKLKGFQTQKYLDVDASFTESL